MTGRRGFALEDVDAGAAEPPRLQCLRQCLGVDECATGRVDEHRIGLHSRQALAAHEAARRLGERAVQGQHVESGQQLVEVPATGGRCATRAIGDLDAHPEGGRDAGDGLAQRAVADDAEDPSLQLADRVGEHGELTGLLPAAARDQRVVVREPVREREQHREHVLGDGGRAVVAQVADRNACLARGREVHVVDAGRGERDQPQLRIGGDRRAVDHGLVGEDRLETGDTRRHIRLRGLRVDHEAGQGALERGRVEVAVADRAEVQEHRAHRPFSRENS